MVSKSCIRKASKSEQENQVKWMIKKIRESDFLKVSDDYNRVNGKQLCIKMYEGLDIIKNSAPLLSIIIPTYRRPLLLKEALESIIAQSGFNDYEIVVVDNEGIGTDAHISETEKIINELNSPKVIYYQNKKNLSVCDNWNLCLSLARGMWVCMVHDDDVLMPDCLRTLYMEVSKNPKIKFLGCINYSFTRPEELKEIQKKKNTRVRRIGYEEFMYGMPVPLLGAFFKRDKAIEIGGFEETSHIGDSVFVAKFSYYFGTYLYKQPLYGYRISMNQDSANNDMNYIRRVADYYLWLCIANRRNKFLKKLFRKNCQYNLQNRIREYNSDKSYGREHIISEENIFRDCNIKQEKLYPIEYLICKMIHKIIMLRNNIREC